MNLEKPSQTPSPAQHLETGELIPKEMIENPVVDPTEINRIRLENYKKAGVFPKGMHLEDGELKAIPVMHRYFEMTNGFYSYQESLKHSNPTG